MPTFDTNLVNAHLRAFRANPVETMQTIPPKQNASGEVVSTSPFAAEDAATHAYSAGRDQVRTSMLQKGGATRAAIEANDDPRKLADTFKYDSLPAIEAAGLRTAKLAVQPWSGDYWATASGGLGNRYAGCGGMGGGWDMNYEYIRTHPSKVILNSGSEVWVNELSPAEKYDALVGDAAETLTRMSWLDGKKYFDVHKEVPGWFGICHGWAPAAFMFPRPAKSVKLLTPNKQTLTFYPCEIKALASLLWARSNPTTRFIGGRCNVEKPTIDPATGRVITLYNPYIAADYGTDQPLEPGQPRPGETEVSLSTETWSEDGTTGREGGRPTQSQCFDTNPGAWHLAVINQIGVSKRSMIMDASFDYQVWNQPLLGYQYTYFNPQTLKQTEKLAEATTTKAAFTSDIFKKYRSPKVVSFVGIVMRVTYMGENGNSQEHTDTPDNDSVVNVDYYYDLELDAAGKIIGGEWYSNSHPDFLWTPPKDGRAVSRYEALATDVWATGKPMPDSWRAAAAKASADMTPLAAIVEYMVKLAQ